MARVYTVVFHIHWKFELVWLDDREVKGQSDGGKNRTKDYKSCIRVRHESRILHGDYMCDMVLPLFPRTVRML
ncbi:hypothetical protein Nepgr_011255 [Nepenthes gracilis]|uniref:Uncharacterized protein n=1 Tax=Nepenthes gracilis TaxID=150966 RepID=A0AAD3SEK9_NEPGR|nr:hypothetical protein Nepgr_011255 [Nepenthes gracilis]